MPSNYIGAMTKTTLTMNIRFSTRQRNGLILVQGSPGKNSGNCHEDMISFDNRLQITLVLLKHAKEKNVTRE